MTNSLSKIVARITGKIDFPCRQEVCNSDRYMSVGGERRCCKDCVKGKGFHTEEVFESLSSYWDDDTGFWRKDIGCILPRNKRSITCNIYVCDAGLALMSDSDKQILDILEKRYKHGSK